MFSATGGIEKVCKVVGKALFDIAKETASTFKIYSMHDDEDSFKDKYFSRSVYQPYKANKLKFSINSIAEGVKCNAVILSHINLALIGYMIKLLSPKTKLVLFTHGIEVWQELPGWKKRVLKKFDQIISVSNYTRNVMISLQQQDRSKCIVINNCLDPYLPKLPSESKDQLLLERYGLNTEDIVLLTLSRLSPHDRDKGYDKVLLALKQLLPNYPQLKYLIVGKYQQAEKQWLDTLIEQYDLKAAVIITGFVSDEELAAHINLADVYVMPSKKEGFGIIFIEAMFYRKPVIAGNKDGSVDALANGELGVLINPDSIEEIVAAIGCVIKNPKRYIPDPQRLREKFGFEKYKEDLKQMLIDLKVSKAA